MSWILTLVRRKAGKVAVGSSWTTRCEGTAMVRIPIRRATVHTAGLHTLRIEPDNLSGPQAPFRCTSIANEGRA